MGENYTTDIFFGTTSYYDYSNGYSTKPGDLGKNENIFDKYKENCEKSNRSWIDDHGFI